MTWESWCALSEGELAARDLAEANLSAAFDLPHAGRLDIAAYRRKIDEWAGLVGRASDRLLPRFRANPGKEAETEAQFRMLVMFTILQRDLGLRYNFDFMHGRWDPTDSRNLFVHGPLSGYGGTCITLPILYKAIGRRLGYPLRLVMAKEHTFCRWEDGSGERFNIETTSLGFAPRTDDYYRSWPKPLSDSDMATGDYLRSLSEREELAQCLCYRGYCRLYHWQLDGAVAAFYYAAQAWPRYEAAWIVSTMVRRAAQEDKTNAVGDFPLKAPRIPPAVGERERELYPSAQWLLNEIIGLHYERRHRAAFAAAFAGLEEDPTGRIHHHDTFS